MSYTEKHFTKEEPMVVYKWVTLTGRAPWGKGGWDLPKNGQRGEERSIGDNDPVFCARGIHGYGAFSQLPVGIKAARLFVAEIWGKVLISETKVVGQHGCLCYEVQPMAGLSWDGLWQLYNKMYSETKAKYSTDKYNTEGCKIQYNSVPPRDLFSGFSVLNSLLVRVPKPPTVLGA